MVPAKPITPLAPLDPERALPPDPIPPKPPEVFKPEETAMFEKPTFITPAKPIPHSPKISPSSIPNPNPSVMAPKQVDNGYPNFGSCLYNIPGYSAFQPINSVNFQPPIPSRPPSIPPPSTIQNEQTNPELYTIPFPSLPKENLTAPMLEEESIEIEQPKEILKPQTDFEEHFTPEIITSTSVPSSQIQSTESKMSITSLAQGSGATITIPASITSNEFKKKPERFSLKTSIPISKIDMKCVSNAPVTTSQNSLAKKTYNKESPRVEIQSNIIIKSATKEPEVKEATPSEILNKNIGTLINAADAINKTDNLFRVPEPKIDPPPEMQDSFNPINIETSKHSTFKPPELSFTDTKNQIVYIQSKKNNSNSKMMFTIQQNPKLLQRPTFEPKNPPAPTRPLNQNKKCKEDVVKESTSSKVVALKRLHQENSDENDFENLITENQIYGNKIVVKEKSQGTSQEQDLKNKQVTEKVTTTETKNVVLQPCNNFVYLSNVQIPANFMMIKNNSKVSQTPEAFKAKIAPIVSSRVATEIMTSTGTVPITESNTEIKTSTSNTAVSNEGHALKSNNSVIQPLPNTTKPDIAKQANPSTSNPDIVIQANPIITQPDIVIQANPIITKPDIVIQANPIITKPDIVIQANPTVIVSPKIVYQLPISTMNLVEPEKIKPPKKREYVQFAPPLLQKIAPKKELPKKKDVPKTNDKLYIACPYQMDAKLQPTIVITNLLPVNKIDEVSAVDNYEKRQRLRRLKHLSNRETKDAKPDAKKVEKTEVPNIIITPENIDNEIYKEFANNKVGTDEDSSGSDTDDYGEDELRMYEDIIEDYGAKADNDKGKVDFMANLSLATQEAYKEKDLELQDKVLRNDSVASAYAAVGRLDMLLNIPPGESAEDSDKQEVEEEKIPESEDIQQQQHTSIDIQETRTATQRKKLFLSKLKLTQVTQKYKEGYDKVWQEILKERKRRNNNPDGEDNSKEARLGFDPNCQLRLLTEIKKCVNENNNLIKKRLDSVSSGDVNDDSIKVLAEKNFSELNRLSKMADNSVKLFKTPNSRKRDLTPGFDSENIKKPSIKIQLPYQDYPKIKIPSISKIISLKTTQESAAATSTQATSMDEPQNSAAGLTEMFEESSLTEKTRDMSCQVDVPSWPDVEDMVKSYKEYDAARRKEVADLHKRNTTLKIEGAHITCSASRDSDHARALLAERQNLSIEENNLRLSLQRIQQAIEVIKNY